MDYAISHRGMLLLCDVQGIPSHLLSCGQSASGIWTPKYCLLLQHKLLLLGPQAISNDRTRNWVAGDMNDSINCDKSFESKNAYSDSGRQYRGMEGQKSVQLTNDELNTFLQKKISPGSRRPKPAKFSVGKDDSTGLPPLGPNSRQSHFDLPFYMPAIEPADQIDLSTCGTEFPGATVRPLHYSILGRDYCFEILTSSGARCFACSSAGERESWIEKIKRAVQPNLDNIRRTEHQLILFVQEAKGLQSKKKYFCEICLDRKLCARTTSKWKNESGIFWAEHFEFSPLPGVQDVTVHLYKDSDKKRKKDKDYIGLVNLSISTLLNQQSVEKWYTLSTPSGNNKNKSGEPMALRIKARFNSTRVLPTEMYKRFGEFISCNYLKISRALSNVISVTRKDEVARILVNIMHGTGCITKFMTEIVMSEVEKVEEESLIFRENTIGTKSVEAVLRLVGMKYLQDILGDFIQALFNMEEECEVDGSRLPPHASLETNQKNLLMSCEIALCKIVTSTDMFPGEMREIMSSWRVQCEAAGRPRIASRLVTASLFLRLLCPAIFNPSLFGLAREVPDARVSRTLTLIAKVIQNLANRTRFGNKEEYMQFMDVFVREKWDEMGTFIDNVSNPSIPPLPKGFQGYIDLGKEFAKLHAFFVEVLKTLNKETIENLDELPELLNEITALLDKPRNSALPSSSGLATYTKDVSVSSSRTQQSVSSVFQSPVDLRHYPNPSIDPRRSTQEDFSSRNRPSLNTCSHNNSNNNISYPAISPPDSSNNNELDPDDPSPDLSRQPPLMFNNPAFQIPPQQLHQRGSRTSLSQLHDSLNLQHTSMLRSYKFNKRQAAPSSEPQPLHSDLPAHAPLMFFNPLQSATNSHQLETTFAAETITSQIDPHPSHSLHNANSNNSSPFARQSSTSPSAPSSVDDLSSGHSHPRPTAHLTKSSSFNPRNDVTWSGSDPGDDEYHLLAPKGPTRPVANAHLRTGLQSCSRGNAPQPKPRHSQSRGNSRGQSVAPPTAQNRSRRGSAGIAKPTPTNEESSRKYPKFELARVDQDVVLKLNEVDSQRKPPTPSSREEPVRFIDELVAAPPAAVKSRVVVSTSNANRVKTSLHGSNATNKYKSPPSAQVARRGSQHKEAIGRIPPQPSPSSHLPPDAPEAPISPEARTAQWILSNNLPSLDKAGKGDDIKAVLFSKDYEDRILRLEAEVDRLRGRLKEENDLHKVAEKREAFLSEKIRAYEKRESKQRKLAKERETNIKTFSQRLNVAQDDLRRERDDSMLLQKQLQSRDELLREQQALVAGLQRKLQILEQRAPPCEQIVSPSVDSQSMGFSNSYHIRDDSTFQKS